jgi:hypothetical protein
MRVLERFCSNLSFPGFFELCLLRGKVVEGEAFTQREKATGKKKMKNTKKGTERKELGSRKIINN